MKSHNAASNEQTDVEWSVDCAQK